MRNIFHLLLIGSLLLLHTSCKEEEVEPQKDGPTPLAFDFYLVNKETGDNLIGVGEEYSYSPGDVELFIMYNNDPSTQKNFVNNYSFLESEEIGYFCRFDYNYQHRIDYIIYLGELKPDTIAILNEKNSFELYINSVLKDQFTLDELLQDKQISRYKLEKEF